MATIQGADFSPVFKRVVQRRMLRFNSVQTQFKMIERRLSAALPSGSDASEPSLNQT
jgi:hypothetical protein